jgi:curved DNA-binding protein CbpA
MTDFEHINYNLYNILKLDDTATSKDIKKAYRKLVLHYHPDKSNKSEDMTELYEKITHAYSVLTNKNKKVEYDIYLKQTNDSKMFNTLKDKFNDSTSQIKQYFESEEISKQKFNEIISNDRIKEETINTKIDKDELTCQLNNMMNNRQDIMINKLDGEDMKLYTESLNKNINDINNINDPFYNFVSDSQLSNVRAEIQPFEENTFDNFSINYCASTDDEFTIYEPINTLLPNNLTFKERIELHEQQINNLS